MSLCTGGKKLPRPPPDQPVAHPATLQSSIHPSNNHSLTHSLIHSHRISVPRVLLPSFNLYRFSRIAATWWRWRLNTQHTNNTTWEIRYQTGILKLFPYFFLFLSSSFLVAESSAMSYYLFVIPFSLQTDRQTNRHTDTQKKKLRTNVF